MKVGILTYHYVYNFGANLQALSTLYYFLSRGYDAKIINWQPKDTKANYDKNTDSRQIEAHKHTWKYYRLTDLCDSNDSVLRIIEEEKFDAIVIGSDAVLQYRPILTDLRITRKIIPRLFYRLQEHSFPNPFMGLISGDNIKVAYMSVSAQNAPVKALTCIEKHKINRYLKSIGFITVRDVWTQDYIRNVERNRRLPVITPDPVFAFNYNCGEILAKEEDAFWEKYHFLKNKKYFLISFRNNLGPKQSDWVDKFESSSIERGYYVFSLPFPQENNTYNLTNQIEPPLTPLEWYLLIKHSKGYVGNNMHPIVSCIHSKVPFFVFDHYTGVNLLTKKTHLYKSKVYDLLNNLGLLNCYYNLKGKDVPPTPEVVVKSLSNDNHEILETASEIMFLKYNLMMRRLENYINEVK